METWHGTEEVNTEKDSKRVGGSCSWRSEGLIGVELQRRRDGSQVFSWKTWKVEVPNAQIPECLEKTRALTLLVIIPLS